MHSTVGRRSTKRFRAVPLTKPVERMSVLEAIDLVEASGHKFRRHLWSEAVVIDGWDEIPNPVKWLLLRRWGDVTAIFAELMPSGQRATELAEKLIRQ